MDMVYKDMVADMIEKTDNQSNDFFDSDIDLFEELTLETLEKGHAVMKDNEKNDTLSNIPEQWEQLYELYPHEFAQVIESITWEIEDVNEELEQAGEFTTVYFDSNFYFVIEYLRDFTVDDIRELFSQYTNNGIYIDRTGAGLIVIEY